MVTSSTVEPKTQECLGVYLYGAGYYARDDNTLGLVTGHGASQPHFCLTCPKRAECEDEHEQRVRRQAPQAVENFERRLKQARRREIPPTLAAVWLAKQGLDPFAMIATENFSRGHADRGRKDGPLVG